MDLSVNFLKGKGKLVIFALIALLGLLLLIFGKGSQSVSVGAELDESAPSLDPQVYAQKLESQVEELCRGVVPDCSVEAVVSLEGGYRSVYASDSQSSQSGYKNSTVLVGSGSSEGAILVCYENPRISGIGIVLSCKEDKIIESKVISLISAAFNVKTNKIHVAFGR